MFGGITIDVIAGSGHIPILVLPECAVGKYVDYFEWNLDRCSNCGSSLFRNYTEKNGDDYETHQICAICNCRLGGFVKSKEN